jgi:aminoethylphosphonate catabolism LysR family transcriptional regulator
MNLSQLRAFDAVVRTGSFTAAAERLFVSQPAVTNHVKALEAYYEVSLFQRHGRGVEPTELGLKLARISRQLFGLEEEAVEILQAHKALRTGTLRIASDGPYVAIPLVKNFKEHYPGVQVSVTIGSTPSVMAALLDERCDIAVQSEAPSDDRLHVLTLTHHPIIVFVSTAHPWAQSARRSISIRELDGAPVIIREPGSTTRGIFEAGCRDVGVSPDYTIETTSRETVKEAVAAGLGIGIIAEPELRPDPRFWPLEIEDLDLEYTEHLICLARRRELRVVREFMNGAARVPLSAGGAGPELG